MLAFKRCRYMQTNIELEYKTLVSREQFILLQTYFAPQERRIQINHYYDFPDFSLLKSHQMVRVREFKDSFEFTLKMYDKDGNLLEFAKTVSANSLNDPEISAFLKDHGIDAENLTERACLRTDRSIYRDEYGELCFDINTYKDKTDYEIEYEMVHNTDQFYQRYLSILKKADIEYQPSLPKVMRCIKEYYQVSDN